MKISSKIGRVLVAVTMLIAFEALANECKKSISSSRVFHQLKTEKNLICIVSDNGKVVISVYRNNEGGAPISKNAVLLDESDLADDAVRLEPAGDGFQIFLEYPNNIYLVGFDADAQRVVESYVLIRLNSISPSAPPQQMLLALTSEQRAALKFESLAKANVFDQERLSLEQPLDAVITAKKSQVSYFFNESSSSGNYLIYGDDVKVVDFNSGWIKIRYGSSQHNERSGWVPLADIL